MKYFQFLILLLIASPLTYAQGNSDFSTQVNISATIEGDVELSTLKSIQVSRLDAINNVVIISPVTNANSGKMLAEGAANSLVRVSFITQKELVHEDGANSLFFNYRVATNDVDNQGTADEINIDNRYLELNENGELFIWIGGQVDISTAIPGRYLGEFTLDIEYVQ